MVTLEDVSTDGKSFYETLVKNNKRLRNTKFKVSKNNTKLLKVEGRKVSEISIIKGDIYIKSSRITSVGSLDLIEVFGSGGSGYLPLNKISPASLFARLGLSSGSQDYRVAEIRKRMDEEFLDRSLLSVKLKIGNRVFSSISSVREIKSSERCVAEIVFSSNDKDVVFIGTLDDEVRKDVINTSTVSDFIKDVTSSYLDKNMTIRVPVIKEISHSFFIKCLFGKDATPSSRPGKNSVNVLVSR